MSAAKVFVLVLAGIIVVFCGYEVWRLMDARAKTPALIQRALQKVTSDEANLPRDRIAELLAVEDPTFWMNNGTDYTSPGAGYTTLTQGLAKSLYYPEGYRKYIGKLELTLFATFALTKLASKRDILNAFLATAYLGNDDSGEINGFSAAAQRIFGKRLSALSNEEYLDLVAMLYAPNNLNPKTNPGESAERVKRIKRMFAHQCQANGFSDVELKGCATP